MMDEENWKARKIEQSVLLDHRYRNKGIQMCPKQELLGPDSLRPHSKGLVSEDGAPERKLFVLCQWFRRDGESGAVIGASSCVH